MSHPPIRKVVVRKLARPVVEVPRPRPDIPLDCPICGRELGFEAHHHDNRFSAQQVWLMRKLDALGISDKTIGLVLRCPPSSVTSRLRQIRHGQRAA